MKRSQILLIIMILFALPFGFVHADVAPLTPSSWYAVAWSQDGDSLHWINAQGEQVSMQRPKMDGEISIAQTRLHISPNGRYLLSIAPLNTGREGIGLYDFETGQWVQTHQTEPNEVVMNAGNYPFTEFSSHFVLSLRHEITNDWRMIVFDTQANAVATLSNTSQYLPQNAQADWFPIVSVFNFDEATNTLDVRFHQMSDNFELPSVLTAMVWRIPPQIQQQSVAPDSYVWGRAGFDINRTTGQVVSTYNNPQVAPAPSASAGSSIVIQDSADQAVQFVTSEANTNLRLAKWLKNGEWIAYWRENQVLQPHWIVMQNNGQNVIPLGNNLTRVHHVNDGFLAVDSTTWTIYHATQLNFEAFSASIGNAIYQSDTAFSLIYTTPTNTVFSLQQVNKTMTDNPPVIVPEGLQVASSCESNAPASRLTVGQDARITVTDGTPLNIRTQAAGDFIMQMPEGTVATVVEGPVCADNYLWWNLSFNNGTGGWAAEGDNDEYYLEPAPIVQLAPPVIQPTLAPIVPVTIQPTPQPQIQVQVVCMGSPQKRLSIGDTATTIDHGGTYALRTNLEDPYPSHQVPANQSVTIIDGPRCRDTFTMWQVQVTLNGQVVTGWLAEGVTPRYYLEPNS